MPRPGRAAPTRRRRDPRPRRPGARGARRRAAVPARRLRDRRPARHRAARRARDRRRPCSRPRSACSSSSPTARPRRWPAGSAPVTCGPRSPRASTACGWRSVLGVATAVARRGRPRRWLVGRFGADRRRRRPGRHYLRWSLPGVPAMLVVLAATGRAARPAGHPDAARGRGRGRRRQRRPQPAARARPRTWGSPAPALGTALTQIGMAVATGVGRRPRGPPARRAAAPATAPASGPPARPGVPLLVRTLALRAAFLVTTYAATAAGPAPLAAHQVAINVWYLLALALDALAIAAQALTGQALGAGDVAGARAATARMVRWGVGGGRRARAGAARRRGRCSRRCSRPTRRCGRRWSRPCSSRPLTQPLAGYVFVLDGVLIGAGDGRYLAVAAWSSSCSTPRSPSWSRCRAPDGTGRAGAALDRVHRRLHGCCAAVFLGLRARSSAWLVTGATR